MANDLKIIEKTYEDSDNRIKGGAYLTRQNFYDSLIHQHDDIKNTGYDWRPNLMKKSMSSYLLGNTDVSAVVEQYNKLLSYIVDKIQDIKKSANYTVDKNYKHTS